MPQVLKAFQRFLDITRLANIDSGLSLHCFILGGRTGLFRRVRELIVRNGFIPAFHALFGQIVVRNDMGNVFNDDNRSSCKAFLIHLTFQEVISTALASGLSTLPFFRPFQLFRPFRSFVPRRVFERFVYGFLAEALKLLALRNVLATNDRRLFPWEAALVGFLAGTVVGALIDGRPWRIGLKAAAKECFDELLVRLVFYALARK